MIAARRTAIALRLALIAWAAPGCGDARHPGASDARPDALATDALATDAHGPTAPDAEAALDDAAVDADAGAPSRLTFRPLLGRTPIEDRLFDLALDPTSLHWAIPNDDGTGTFTRLVRESRVGAPSDGPILRVTAEPLRISAVVTDALADGAPLDAIVWVGRRVDAGGQLPVVSLLGTDGEGRAIAADLPADPALISDGAIEWACYHGRWSGGAIGVVTLSIVDGEEGLDLFVTGPSLTRATRDRPRGPPPLARARPFTSGDRRAQDALRQLRQRPRPQRVVDPALRPRSSSADGGRRRT